MILVELFDFVSNELCWFSDICVLGDVLMTSLVLLMNKGDYDALDLEPRHRCLFPSLFWGIWVLFE